MTFEWNETKNAINKRKHNVESISIFDEDDIPKVKMIWQNL